MKTKVCADCRRELPTTDFQSKGKNTHRLQSYCKECSARKAREYKQQMRDYVAAYKLAKGCEICGFQPKHSCQLDLDHNDPDTKVYKGSHKAYDAGWSKERIDAELAKCTVTCKNCHALRTYEERHWENSYTSVRMR